MKIQRFAPFGIAAFLWILGLGIPVPGNAGVNVDITIPLPGLAIPAPPAMVVIQGTYVYYPPDVQANIFFYHGYWYRPYRGHWFISPEYNGPWGGIAIGRVPRPVLGIPPHFRHVAPGYERVPYSVMRKNWRVWERDRYWDKREGRKGYRRDEERGERGERDFRH